MTPAVNESHAYPGVREYSYYVYGDLFSHTETLVSTGLRTRVRPKSFGGLRRADLTYPPKGWSHTWHTCRGVTYGWNRGDPSTIYYVVKGQVGSVVTGYDVKPDFDQRILDQATFKALLQLKNQKVNIGVMLAEARQTAELIGSTARTIAKSLDGWWGRATPQTINKWAKSKWRRIPKSYLEMEYGWKPLMRDVYGAAEALADAFHGPRPVTFQVTGSARRRTNLALPIDDGLIRGQWEGTLDEAAHVGFVMELPNYLLRSLVEAGITNPLEVIWEKVPYSFVADWFWPFGPWLSTLDAGAFVHFREGYSSQIYRYKGAASVSPIPGKPERVTGISDSLISGGNFRRKVLTGLPFFPPLPMVRDFLKLDRLAKSLALLTQAASGRAYRHDNLQRQRYRRRSEAF